VTSSWFFHILEFVVFHYCDTAFFNCLSAPAVFGTTTLQNNLLANRGEE